LDRAGVEEVVAEKGQMHMAVKYHYGKMTWPEVKRAAAQGRVALLPVGCIEDHGPHLPLDVDVLLPTAVCERAAQLVPEECVLVPGVSHGYDPHHLDFPGVIHVDGHVFARTLVDICKSLIHHGFPRIIMVNGHGSNTAYTEIAARLAVIETEGKGVVFAINYWGLAELRKVVRELRDSPHGGIAHGGEMETSLYLALDPQNVQMELAQAEFPPEMPLSLGGWSDLINGRLPEANQVAFMPYWSTFSKTGVRGDPTQATAEKGRKFLEAAARGLAQMVHDLRTYPFQPREDHH
jgi:creatinine amidohydrolase